jgi:hypothetical protein
MQLAVHTLERRQQERSAQQAARVAHGGDGDIELGPGTAERRKVGHHHHRRDVAALHLVARDHHPELRQDVGYGLAGGAIARAVARPGQAGHDAISHQRVVAPAVDAAEFLQAHVEVVRRGRQRGRDQQQHEQNERALHSSPNQPRM